MKGLEQVSDPLHLQLVDSLIGFDAEDLPAWRLQSDHNQLEISRQQHAERKEIQDKEGIPSGPIADERSILQN